MRPTVTADPAGAARTGGAADGAAAGVGPLRFVALGDSLTEGVGDPVPGGWRGWAAVLAGSLAPDPARVAFTNLARSGALSTDLAAQQLPAALALRPRLAAVVVGGNDTLRAGFDIRRTTRELDTVLTALAGHGSLLLTACLPDPGALLRLPLPLARPLARRMAAVNTVVHALSERHRTVHLHLADLPWTAERRLLSADRLHPSADGHHLIARGFHRLLADRPAPGTAAGDPSGGPPGAPAGPARGLPTGPAPGVPAGPPRGLALGPEPRPSAVEAPPGRAADLWWMATRGTRWVAERSTDLLPGLLALAALEGLERLRGATGRLDEQMARAAAAALAGLGRPDPPTPRGTERV
ncbi:SGNH/GDSL hydrolase family protein [Kitasatospora sp. NPDC054939]